MFTYRAEQHISENVATCLLILPLCVDNPDFHEHCEHNSLQSREAVREGKYYQVVFKVFPLALSQMVYELLLDIWYSQNCSSGHRCHFHQ